jgi:superfamily II DNA/RNA helicase
MYRSKKSNYNSRGKNGNNYFESKDRFQRQSNRYIKKLDPSLFIKKAVAAIAEEPILNGEKPKTSFGAYLLSDKLARNIQQHGYSTPTPIQERTIPSILDGRDVIGIANTGTGKTAAFLIPLVNKAFLDRNERVLIVTPTRELAMQIVDELQSFTIGMNLDSALCIGGANMSRQEKKLHHNPHFVIGTPGRLKDLITRRKLNLLLFGNIVLDEVDRMVDIGFIQDIKFFISQLPKKRQSLFFSATVSDKVKEIVQSFVSSNAITASVKTQDTAENVEQDIIRVVGGNKKVDILHNLLTKKGFDKVLIFGRTKWGIEKLTKSLIDRGFRADSIHGNKRQGQRQRVIEQFKRDEIRILLATDVASRGLDIENVTHVINYDAPESYDDYIHRIGRTGRAGKKGIALTFVE